MVSHSRQRAIRVDVGAVASRARAPQHRHGGSNQGRRQVHFPPPAGFVPLLVPDHGNGCPFAKRGRTLCAETVHMLEQVRIVKTTKSAHLIKTSQ